MVLGARALAPDVCKHRKTFWLDPGPEVPKEGRVIPRKSSGAAGPAGVRKPPISTVNYEIARARFYVAVSERIFFYFSGSTYRILIIL